MPGPLAWHFLFNYTNRSPSGTAIAFTVDGDYGSFDLSEITTRVGIHREQPGFHRSIRKFP